MFSTRNIKTGACCSAAMVMVGAFTAYNMHGVLPWVLVFLGVLGDLLIVLAPATAFQPKGWVYPVGLSVWACTALRHACLSTGRSRAGGHTVTTMLSQRPVFLLCIAAGSTVGAMSDQVHGRILLPGWLVLLLACAHAMLTTQVFTSAGMPLDWGRLILSLLTVVFIPWLVEDYLPKARLASAARQRAQSKAGSVTQLGAASAAPSSSHSRTSALQHSKALAQHTALSHTKRMPSSGFGVCILSRLQRKQQTKQQSTVSADDDMLYQQACPRMKVVAKVHTDAGLDALPSEWPSLIQAGCCASDGPTLQLLTCAARWGCILLSIDVAPLPSQPQHVLPSNLQPGQPRMEVMPPAIQGHHAASMGSSELFVADSVLLSLQPILSQLESSSVGTGDGPHSRPLLPHGLRVTVQVEQQMYEALWDAALSCWGVRACAQAQPAPPKACLGLIRLAACLPLAAPAHSLTRRSTGSSLARSSNSITSTNHDAGSSSTFTSSSSHSGRSGTRTSSGVISCRLQVQVWDWTGPAAGVEGWSPKLPDAHEQAISPLEEQNLSILVHTGGQYLTTCVHPVPQEQLQSSMVPARAMVLNVDVEVPTALLVRHHQPDGPPTGLQPMVVELWVGQHMLHSTQVLLQLNQQAGQQAARSQYLRCLSWGQGGGYQRVWWWGAKPRAVQAAVQELHVAVQKLWALGAAVRLSEVQAHQAWQADMVTWLQAVQQGAGRCGRCQAVHSLAETGSTSSCGTTMPRLSAALAQHTGQCLMQHAARFRLHAVHAMLSQQMQQVIQPWAGHNAVLMARPRHIRDAAAAALQLMHAAMWGFPCEHCEAAYKARLSKQLAGLQLCGAGLQVATCAIAAYQQLVQWRRDAAVPFAIVAALGLLTMMRLLIVPGACCSLAVASWVLRIIFTWTWAKQHEAGLMAGPRSCWIAMHAFGRVRDQLPASVFLPAPITTCLSTLDGMTWLRVLCQHPNSTLLDWLLLAGGMLVVWLLQLQVRSILKPGGKHKEVTASSGSHAACCPHAH